MLSLPDRATAKILEERANDGARAPDTYRPQATVRIYVPTASMAASQWPKVKPFALTGASQFRPAAPIALHSAEWAADYNEIKEFGGRTSAKRSARQTEDAHFWLVVDGRGYHPVIRTLVEAKKLSLIDSARLFALAAVAREDALIAVFDAKYHYELAQLAACMSSARACLPFRTLLRGVRCDALRQPRLAALVAQLAPIIGRPASVCRIPACQRRRAHGRLPLPSAAEQHHLSGGREPFCTRFHQTFDGTSGGGDQAFLNTVVRASLTHAITGLEILR
jgi:hypothetical protein